MAKKKFVKKTKTKKPASKKQPVKSAVKKTAVKASAAKPAVKEAAKQAAPAPIRDKGKPKWAAWLPLVAVAIPVLLAVVYVVNRPSGEVNSGPNSDNTDTSIQVVPGQAGGISSNQAGGALQPQATGLQQTQSNTQLTGGSKLQYAPNNTTIR